jgi:hypothetical protein
MSTIHASPIRPPPTSSITTRMATLIHAIDTCDAHAPSAPAFHIHTFPPLVSTPHTPPHVYTHTSPPYRRRLGDQSESDDTDEARHDRGATRKTPSRSDQNRVDTGILHGSRGSNTCALRLHLSRPFPKPRRDGDRPAQPSLFKRLFKTLTSLSPPLVASLSRSVLRAGAARPAGYSIQR